MFHFLFIGKQPVLGSGSFFCRSRQYAQMLVSTTWISLGKIFFHQNNVDNAISCLEESMEIKKSKLSEKHMSLAETRHLLGSLYIKKENFAPAVALLKCALVAYRGSRDCEIMKSDVLDLLGGAYANLGETDHAILSYETSLKIKKAVVGAESSPSSNVLMEIGKLRSSKGDMEGSLAAFKEGDFRTLLYEHCMLPLSTIATYITQPLSKQ